MSAPVCPYCGNQSRMVTGKEVWPHRPDLHSKPVYLCAPCNAYVGCHPGTTKPLGRLADAELRKSKLRAHDAFDPIWQARFERRKTEDPRYKKGMARGGRYKRLAELMGIPKQECHIGMFNVTQCKQVIAICEQGLLES